MQDAHRYPFSLLSAARLNPSESSVERSGGVYESVFDKEIGRPVLQIKGAVSANNYIEFSNLALSGRYMYVMLQLHKADVCTFHFEVETAEGYSMRISISTLFDQVRFLGRSLRLPLPRSQNWMILGIDIKSVFANYCLAATAPTPKHIKRIQFCSNMTVKDCITSDVPLVNDSKHLPKEFLVKASADLVVDWVSVPADVSADERVFVHFSPADKASVKASPAPANTSPAILKSTAEHIEEGAKGKKLRPKLSRPKTMAVLAPSTEPLTRSASVSRSISFGSGKPEVASISKPLRKASSPRSPLRSLVPNTMSSSKTWVSRSLPRRISLSTPTSVNLGISGSVFKLKAPDTADSERCLTLDAVLQYQGGPALLLEDGMVAVHASGPTIVLTDLSGEEELDRKAAGDGLWKLFSKARGGMARPQAYMQGHSSAVVLLEVSPSRTYLFSAEASKNGLFIVWDLATAAKKLAAFRPHADGIVCAAINNAESMLCTVGFDANRRVQLIVWDLMALLRDRIGVSPPSPSKAPIVIAKQISDFHISRIAFSPTVDDSLVSCGRENIRFWRIKKGHLPGRPVMLNEFSRGFVFDDLGYATSLLPSSDSNAPSKGVVFVASNKGILLRVDCDKEQVVCAYQLHSGAITSLLILKGFAVTGGSDKKLRIWPLDFHDFLLESIHESSPLLITSSASDKKLIVGTSSGTLGVLDTTSHVFTMILRSHTKRINAVVARPGVADELVTLSSDGTFRIWDTLTLEEKYEFNSPNDEPLCGAFHPTIRTLAVGFKSGAIRIFDIHTTSMIHERSVGGSSVCSSVQYSRTGDMLFAASTDGTLHVFDVISSYMSFRSISIESGQTTDEQRFPFNMSFNHDGSLLACVTNNVSSLTVVDTEKMHVVFRVQMAVQAPSTLVYKPMVDGAGDASEAAVVARVPPQKEVTDALSKLQIAVGSIVGVAFLNSERASTDQLLLASSKCIISIPVLEKGIKASDENVETGSVTFDIRWSDKYLRRVDFGVPKSLCKCSGGVFFMLVQAPDTMRDVDLNEHNADSLAVFSISMKPNPNSQRNPITLSTAQLYEQTKGTGFLVALAPCLPCNRVVGVDDTGAVFAWRVKQAKLSRLAQSVQTSPPDFVTPMPSAEMYSTNFLSELPTDKKDAIQNLTLDFEHAVETNPHLWSADSKAEVVAEDHADASTEQVVTESLDITIEEAYEAELELGEIGDMVLGDSLVSNTSVRISLGAARRSKEEDATTIASYVVDDDMLSAAGSFTGSRYTRIESEEEDDDFFPRDGHVSTVELLAGRFAVQPQYYHEQRTLLQCDGHSLYLRNMVLSRGVSLVQGPGAKHSKEIFTTSMAPSGLLIVALVGTLLEVNAAVKYSNIELLLWRVNEDNSWAYMGNFELDSDIRSCHLDWTPLNDLVLFARLEDAHGRARLCVVPSELTDNKNSIQESLRSYRYELMMRGDVQRMVSINRLSRVSDSSLLLLLWGGSRMQIVKFDLLNNTSPGELLWTEYIGSNGLYIDVDIVSLSRFLPSSLSKSSESLVVPVKALLSVALDSFGLETARFNVCKLDGETGFEVKSCQSHMTGAYVFGTPKSLKLSSCGGILAVGHNLCIRVFSTTVKGFFTEATSAAVAPFNVALTILHKISLTFQPDYVLLLPFASIAEDLPVKSNVAKKTSVTPGVLACSRDGSLGFIASDKSECTLIHSAPASVTKDTLVLASTTNLLTVKQKNSLTFVHASTGIKLPVPGNPAGINTCSCVKYSSDGVMLAIGGTSGRVTIYLVQTMAVIKIIECPVKTLLKSVLKVLFADSNRVLIVSYGDGSVYLVDLNRNISESISKLISANTKDSNVQLCSSSGDDKYWGLLKPSVSEFEIHRVMPVERDGGSTDIVDGIVWHGIIKDRLALNKYSKGNRVHDVGTIISDAHMIPTDDGFLVKCVFTTVSSNSVRQTFVGTLVAARRKSYETDITRKEVIFKYLMPFDNVVSYAFASDHLVAATTKSILLYDISRAKFHSHSANVMATLDSGECFNGAADWRNTIICACTKPVAEEIEDASINENEKSLELFVLGGSRLFRVKFAVTELSLDD